MNSKSAY